MIESTMLARDIAAGVVRGESVAAGTPDATASVVVDGTTVARVPEVSSGRNVYEETIAGKVHRIVAAPSPNVWYYAILEFDGKYWNSTFVANTAPVATLAELALYPWLAGTFTKTDGTGPLNPVITKGS